MCPALNYGKIIRDVLYYPGSEINGSNGMIDLEDESKVWNHFQSRIGSGKGVFLEIILGIGAHRSVNPYSPQHKSLWYILSEYIGFEIVSGSNIGTIRVNMQDIISRKDAMLELGVALMFFATRCSRKKYEPSFALADFGIVVTQVSNF